MPDMSKPFTESDHQAINDRLRSLNAAKEALDRAQSAGINCADWPEICQQVIDSFQGIKTTYFRDKP